MLNQATIWFLSALILLLLEGCFSGLFFFLSISFGCFCASIASFLLYSFALQGFFALFASGLGFLLLKRFLNSEKLSNSELKSYQSNFCAIIGAHGVAATSFKEGQSGQVRLDGELWHAKNIGPDIFVGDSVVVLKIEGNRVFVRKAGQEQKS